MTNVPYREPVVWFAEADPWRAERRVYRPQPDITTYELAQITALLANRAAFAATHTMHPVYRPSLLGAAMRHFIPYEEVQWFNTDPMRSGDGGGGA